MTTLTFKSPDFNVAMGFFVVLMLGLAAGGLARGNTGSAIIAAVIAAALAGVTVALHRRPRPQLRIAPASIELWSPKVMRQAITRQASGGRVRIVDRIHRGRAFRVLVGPSGDPEIHLAGFDDADVEAACGEHGWAVERAS